MNVLIVDDSTTARKVMRRIMKTLEFEIHESALSADALSKLSTRQYDVVLLDWNMPDIPGVELVRELRQRETERHLPILMVTQNTEKEHIITALQAGVDEYIMKPFTAKALREKLLLMGIIEPSSPTAGAPA